MVEMVARSAQVLIALGGAYVVAFWFVLIVWTFRDIEARSRSVVTQVVSTLMVVLFFVPGVLLYMILRPKETLDEAFQRSLEEEYLLQDLEELPLCPACHRFVEDDFVLCPHCHAQLREPCVACARLVDLKWPLCPYCATVQHGRAAEAERVEAPAARWTAPGLRRRRGSDEAAVGGRSAAAVSNGRGEPTEPAAAAAVDVAPAAEPRAVPFTLVSGMRSIVRPLDRVRGRNGHGHGTESSNGHEDEAASPPPAANGASGRFDRHGLEGDPLSATGAGGSASNGRKQRLGFGNDLFSVNGAGHREDGSEQSAEPEEAVAERDRADGVGTGARETDLVEIPGRRR
jgi:RNA polymerase subunit RPABC4/transcription elongation factor Spt4